MADDREASAVDSSGSPEFASSPIGKPRSVGDKTIIVVTVALVLFLAGLFFFHNPDHVDRAALARINRSIALVAPGIGQIDLAHMTSGAKVIVVDCRFDDDVVTDRPGLSREWQAKGGHRASDAVSDLSNALRELGFRPDGQEQVDANVNGTMHSWDFVRLVSGEKLFATISWDESAPTELRLYVQDATSTACSKSYL